MHAWEDGNFEFDFGNKVRTGISDGSSDSTIVYSIALLFIKLLTR